jgi:hypothetical protein
MASLNSNVSLKRMTLEANLVFTSAFNFKGPRDASLQALAHSCLPFPLFFVLVIVFYNDTWASFIDAFLMDAQIFKSLMAYS